MIRRFIFLSLICLISLAICSENNGIVTYEQDTHAGGVIDVVKVDSIHFRITATPAPGYSFVKWSDGVTTQNRQHVHTANETSDVAYYAIFTKDDDITTATGKVAVNVVSSYPDPFVYQLTAVPNAGYAFCTWSNGYNLPQVDHYTDKDGQYKPFFASSVDVLSTTYFEHSGGVVSGEQNGMSYSFTATPKEGYSFLSWSDGITDNPRMYVHPSTVSDTVFQAVFVKNEDINRPYGTIQVQITNPSIPSFRLKAIPDDGATFKAWNDGTTFTNHNYIETDVTRIPFFLAPTSTVSIFYVQHVGGEVQTELLSTDDYNVLAVPADGYSFKSWADGSTQNPRMHKHLPITPDSSYIAVFTKDSDILRPYGSLQVDIVDSQQPSFILTANPESNAKFYAWDNANMIPKISYNETDGQRLAFFEPLTSDMSIRLIQRSGGNVSVKSQTSNYDILATPNSGYSFLSWIDGVQNNPRTVNVVADTLFRAVFVKDDDMQQENGHIAVAVTDKERPSFLLTATSDDPNANFFVWNNGLQTPQVAYVESDGKRTPYFIMMRDTLSLTFEQHVGGIVTAEYKGGTTYDFLATPNTGYSFMSWSDGVKVNPRTYQHPQGGDAVTFHAVFTYDDDVNLSDGNINVKIVNPDIPNYRLTATPNSGDCSSDFYLWNNGSNTKSIYYIEADGRRVPYFVTDDEVSYRVDSSSAGYISVLRGECSFTIKAIPNEGYYFDHWLEDASLVNMRDVDYDEGIYTAVFNQNPFRVNGEYYGTIAEAIAAADGIAPVEVVLEIQGDIYLNDKVILDGNNHTIQNLHILPGGVLNLTDYLTVNNLYIGTTSGSSAQLVNYSKYLTYENAYLDITLETPSAVVGKWYAFSTPFAVDVSTGVTRASGIGSHISGKDYVIWEYNGNTRALTGSGWVRLLSGTIQPGKIYMLGVSDTENTWRFKKIPSSPLEGEAILELHAFPTSNPDNLIDPGWNGVGNDLLQYASVSVSPVELHYLQVYDNVNSKYIPLRLDGTSFAIGTPFFVQVDADAKLTLNPDIISGKIYAPKRKSVEFGEIEYELRLTNESMSASGLYFDALFMTAHEEATNNYQIGKDVLKILGSTNSPYIWANAYGYQLCAQDIKLEYDFVDYAVSIYVPQSGNYILSLSQGEDDVYLMQNGFVIAELSAGDYSVDLNKGTHKYIIRIGHQYLSPTNIERNGDVDCYDKFIYNDNMYIRTNEHIFNANGILVK